MGYLQVLSNVSKRLADMHAAGIVHRDLKPANVMWLPRENRWTVIDFGCVARVGDQAPLNFTLAYAAPEVIAACTAGERTILAAPAVDAWSLGVMAFELLTGAPAFQLVTQGSQVVRPVSPVMLHSVGLFPGQSLRPFDVAVALLYRHLVSAHEIARSVAPVWVCLVLLPVRHVPGCDVVSASVWVCRRTNIARNAPPATHSRSPLKRP